MKKIYNLPAKVMAIINTPLENIVPELRPLLAVLLLSPNVECDRLRISHPNDQLVDILLDSVKNFRADEDLYALYCREGFFVEQLQHLLSVAQKNRNAARRLMPVFCTALTQKETLCLPPHLETKIIRHIEAQRKLDHFAITALEPGNIAISPAPGYAAE